MKRTTDELMMGLLDGSLTEQERSELLDLLDARPELADDLRAAARGWEAVAELGDPGVDLAASRPPAASGPRRISPWWAAAASAATLAVAVPGTLAVHAATGGAAGAAVVDGPTVPAPVLDATTRAAAGQPVAPEPSYVLVLHGRWPDAREVDEGERRRRAEEYWGWTSSLADDGVLVAAGDLTWEPGERLGPSGARLVVDGGTLESPDYVVGMFAVRAGTYQEALAVARECPHLRYGGSVSVRRVGGGFVTMPGMDDWTD